MLVLPRLPSSFEKGKNVGFLFSYSKWKMFDNLPTELLSPEVAEKGGASPCSCRKKQVCFTELLSLIY